MFQIIHPPTFERKQSRNITTMSLTTTLTTRPQSSIYGQRIIITLKKKNAGTIINSLTPIDSFNEWQLINKVTSAQGIIFPYRNNQILIYLPKMGMCPQFHLLQIKSGSWKLIEEFILPKDLCDKLNINTCSQLKPGFYHPIDLGGHLVFRLTWTSH